MKKLRYGGNIRLNYFRYNEFDKEEGCDIIEEPENDPGDNAVFIGESAYLQDSAIPGAHQCGNKCGDGQLSPSKEEGIYILP